MAKSLETVFADFKPSPLQQAAIERIHEFKKELLKYGMFVHSSMELEFTSENGEGMPIRCVLDSDKAKAYFDNEPNIKPYIEKVVSENDLARPSEEYASAKLEITAADTLQKNAKGYVTQSNPEILAGVIDHIKKDSLRKMLLASTCLEGRRPIMPDIRPNFAARPYYNSALGDNDRSARGNISSSLHINVSLCDKDGRNIFGLNNDLFKHCTNAVADIQREGGLAMMPNANSVTRITSRSTAPQTIGLQVGKDYKVPDPDVPSICARDDMFDFDTGKINRKPEFFRIENKLPGADTDPFVGMAVTMAALVDAVRKNVMLVEQPDKQTIRLRVAKPVRWDMRRDPMPTEHSVWVERFAESTRMRELLGEKLYSAIQDGYGKMEVVAL